MYHLNYFFLFFDLYMKYNYKNGNIIKVFKFILKVLNFGKYLTKNPLQTLISLVGSSERSILLSKIKKFDIGF